MFDFFDILIGYLETLFSYIFGMLESFVRGLVLIATALEIPSALSGFMPGILGTAVMAVSAILVIRFLCLK